MDRHTKNKGRMDALEYLKALDNSRNLTHESQFETEKPHDIN